MGRGIGLLLLARAAVTREIQRNLLRFVAVDSVLPRERLRFLRPLRMDVR
jgi:hypothetical protein